MTDLQKTNPIAATEEALGFYTEGKFMQAWRCLTAAVDLDTSTDPEALILGGRILGHLYAYRRSTMLFYRAMRSDRRNFSARVYAISSISERLGAFRALLMIDRVPSALIQTSTKNPKSASNLSHWWSLRSELAASMRDFDTAEEYLKYAEQAEPDTAWILRSKIQLLLAQDKYAEAMSLAKPGITQFPLSTGVHHYYAMLLDLEGKREEAIAHLKQVVGQFESPHLLLYLMSLQRDAEDYLGALESLNVARGQMPVVEDDSQFAYGAEASLHYLLGNYSEFERTARLSGSGYYLRTADYFAEQGQKECKKLLDVPFIRQHHLTCAPATLAAICRYFDQPGDHLDIADAICYAGTPYVSQRKWADEHGWYAREFTVNYETARQLIDRGVPFTLSTTGAGYAHLQAVAGYDARIGTLIIRDPYNPRFEEPLGREMLQRLAPYGPRGMVLVPADQQALVADVTLPDCDLYDSLYRLEATLSAHNREEAAELYMQLKGTAPDHASTYFAGIAIASYDKDRQRHFELVEERSKLWPTEPNLLMNRISWLRTLGRREDRLALLEQICNTRKAEAKKPAVAAAEADTAEQDVARAASFHPIFLHQLASVLIEDARTEARAEGILLRAIRMSPQSEESFWTLASLYWQQGHLRKATEIYRYASCLDPYDEGNANSYYIAEAWLGNESRALKFLRDRASRFAKKSHYPVLTLFDALENSGRMEEAFKTLSAAIDADPENGELRLFAAEAYARYGQTDVAERLIEKAVGQCSDRSVLRTRARLKSMNREQAQALDYWEQLLALDPLSLDTHRECAYLKAQLNGPAAAIEHYRQAAARYPDHFELHRNLARWLRSSGKPEENEAVLLKMVEIDPSESWTWLELALVHSTMRQHDRAIQDARMAIDLEPRKAAAHGIMGDMLLAANDVEAARAEYITAIQLDVNYEYAHDRLMLLCTTAQEKRKAANLISAELSRQSNVGSGIESFVAIAEDVLDPHAIQYRLTEIIATRPGAHEAHLCLVDFYLGRDQRQEALEAAQEAVRRFPLIPDAWQRLAAVKNVMADPEGAREALGYALKISPKNADVARQLAGSYAMYGDYEKAIELTRQAVSWNSLDRRPVEYLAYLLNKTGRVPEAIEAVKRALEIDWKSTWSWGALSEWCAQENRQDEASTFARKMAAERPDEYSVWLAVASVLYRPADAEERLSALRRALELNPRCEDAYCDLADLLAELRRYDEALEALNVPAEMETSVIRMGRADVHYASGNLDLALAQVKQITEDDPNNVAARRYYTQLLSNSKEDDTYLASAQAFAEQDPSNHLAWYHVGAALKRKARKHEAIAAFDRACELQPDYSYSAVALMNLQLEIEDLDAAERTLKRIASFEKQGWAIGCELRLAVARKNSEGVAAAIQRLCLTSSSNASLLSDLTKHANENGFSQAARAGIEAALSNPETMPEAGRAWMEAVKTNRSGDVEPIIKSALTVGPAGGFAASGYINDLIERKEFKQVRKFMEANREALCQYDQSWAVAAYGFVTLARPKDAVAWTEDWTARKGVEAWMLLNRSAGLRQMGRYEESAEISRHALTLDRDYSSPQHAIWILYQCRISNKPDDPLAASIYQSSDLDRLTGYYRYMMELANAMQVAADISLSAKERLQTAAKAHRRAIAAYPSVLKSRLSLRIYTRARWKCVQSIGGMAYLWLASNVALIDLQAR
jgi:cellulose synthase operon protein C